MKSSVLLSPLQYRHVLLTSLELSAIAQHTDTRQVNPRLAILAIVSIWSHTYIRNLTPVPISHDPRVLHYFKIQQLLYWSRVRLTWLLLTGVRLNDLIVKPHVSHCHPVLCQCTRLIWADGWRRAESLHSLQILNEAVFASHTLGCQRQTHLQPSHEMHFQTFHIWYSGSGNKLSKTHNNANVRYNIPLQ